MKRKIVVYVLPFLVIIVALFYMFNIKFGSNIQPTGSKVSEESLIHDLKVISSDKVVIEYINVFDNKKTSEEAIYEKDGTIDETAKLLVVSSKTKNNSKLNNVPAAMKMMLYIHQRTLPYTVKGINFVTTRKFMVDRSWSITLTQIEFLEMYNAVKDRNLAEDEVIQELSSTWINKHNYRGWLK